MEKILVTGSSGFIGMHLCKSLLYDGHQVMGIDNMNDYYDPSLKELRLGLLRSLNKELNTSTNFEYFKEDVSNKKFISHLFENNDFDYVVHLAAQAGVRYSLTNPDVYIKSNINGFFNILEGCRHSEIKHLLFASSSSVYGMNSSMPFSTSDLTDFPISLYAATKKSNELMAFTYSHLYNIPSTGLRFFTVYGPSGRPDMAYYKFTKSILEGDPIEVYNRGEMKRDFFNIYMRSKLFRDSKNTYLVNRLVSAPFFEKTHDSDLSILDYIKIGKSPDYFDIFPMQHYILEKRELFGRNTYRNTSSSHFEMITSL